MQTIGCDDNTARDIECLNRQILSFVREQHRLGRHEELELLCGISRQDAEKIALLALDEIDALAKTPVLTLVPRVNGAALSRLFQLPSEARAAMLIQSMGAPR